MMSVIILCLLLLKIGKCVFNGISECKKGYYGDSCDEPCPQGSFGLKCGGNCLPRCTKEECDHVSGCEHYIQNITQNTEFGRIK